MKNIISVLILWTISLSVGQAGTLYKLNIDGLACPYCAYGIEKTFINNKNVKDVDIDIQNGLVLVTTKSQASFTENELKTIVNDTGFTLNGYSTETIDE